MGRNRIKKPKKFGQKRENGLPKGVDSKIIDMTPEEVDAFLALMRLKLTPTEADTIIGMAASMRLMAEEVRRGRVSVNRLRAILFGEKTEKTKKVCQPKSNPKNNDPNEKEKKNKDKEKNLEKKPGHGRNGHRDLAGANTVEVPCETLKAGDPCIACPKGKVHPVKEPKVIVRFVGMTPIKATVYKLEKLRCNACGITYTANAPEEAGSKRHDESVSATIAIWKYGMGVPFTRLARFQKLLGVSLPTSNQWEIVDEAAELLDPLLKHFFRIAAQGDVIHMDDTSMKILDRPDLRIGKNGKERKGIYTSGFLSKVPIGDEIHSVALFITGMHHAGENLENILRYRSEVLSKPIQMCDALSANTSGELNTIVSNCLAHARRKYVEIIESFPEEAEYILNEISKVYKNDSATKEMGSKDRLAYHKTHSKPIMDELSKRLKEQADEQMVEPNSALGQAIKYLRKHWDALTLFLREAGAPLDNNICERALKKAVLHRKNSMFYKTLNGAYVGDLFMSLIHTAELNGANPFDYLVEVQKNIAFVKENPEEWMPWNYKETLTQLP